LTCTRLDCSAPLTPVDGPVSVVAADDELPGAADAGPASESLPQTLPLSLSGTLRIADGFELDGRVLRMALVWYPAYLDGPIEPFTPSAMCANPEGLDLSYRGLVAQELPLAQELQDELLLAPQFPLPFSVQITELPPAEALRPLPDGQPGSWSTGKLIVYEDCDENGRLDSSSLAETAQDTVLGTSSDWFASVGQFEDVSAWYDIYYAEARISSPRVEAGFSIQRILNDPMAGYPSAMLPIETEVEIALSASARIATLNCEELCHVGDEAFECPTDVASLPTGGVFQCYGRGDLLWSRENCDGCTCTSVSCAMASPSAGPLPSDWPCD
jgi:hypothetical protein